MRSIQNVTLRFGQVAVPVGLAPAQSRGDDPVELRTLHRPCGVPIKQTRSCPRCETDVLEGELVKGVEVGPGQYLVLDDTELEATLTPKVVQLDRYVPVDHVDELHRDRLYWATPPKDILGRRAYKVMLTALEQTGLAGVGRLVLRTREHVALVRPLQGLLAIETLYAAEHVRPPDEPAKPLAATKVEPEELALAVQLVTQHARRFRPTRLSRDYPSKLSELVQAKIDGGHQIAVPAPHLTPPADLTAALTPPADLTAALQQSIRRRGRRHPAAANT